MKSRIKVLSVTMILLTITLTQSLSAFSPDEIPVDYERSVEDTVVLSVIPEPSATLRTTTSIEGERIALTGKDLYVSYIYEAQRTYFQNLDPVIVQAVMQCESNYIPTIQSDAGAVGLMQVLPKYHSQRMHKYGLTDIWDPYTNIIVGMDFLNESYQKYGNYYDTLKAYNNSDRYVRHVLSVAEQIRYGGA